MPAGQVKGEVGALSALKQRDIVKRSADAPGNAKEDVEFPS